MKPQNNSFKIAGETYFDFEVENDLFVIDSSGSDRNILKKIEYFNSNHNKNIQRSPNNWRSHKNVKKEAVKTSTEHQKSSPKIVSKVNVKENVSSISKLRKPLFVNKYSPYKKEPESPKPTSLIMTAGME